MLRQSSFLFFLFCLFFLGLRVRYVESKDSRWFRTWMRRVASDEELFIGETKLCLRTIVVGTFSQITFRRKEFLATGDYEPPIDVSL